MKNFRVSTYRFMQDQWIEEVEVDRETESSVWINGRRRARQSEYEMFFSTREKAKDFLVRRMQSKVELARSSLCKAGIELREVLAL